MDLWRHVTQPFMPLYPLPPCFKQPVFQLPIPILHQTVTLRNTSVCLLFGYKVCSLVWRNVTQQSKLVQCLLFLSFYSILSICIYQRVWKAQSRVSVYSFQGPFVASQGDWHQSSLPAKCWAFPMGIFPLAVCSLCLSGWQTEQFLSAFYVSEGARGIRLDSEHLCFAAVHPCPLILWIQMAISSKHTRICTCRF